MQFNIHYGGEEFKAFLPGLGKHNVYNALATICATHQVGLELDEILTRLRTFNHMERHTTICYGPNETTFIDDTWNANPSSTYAAIDVLHEIGQNKRKITVIGKLQRLGAKEGEEHKKLGKFIAQSQVSHLVTVGESAKNIGVAAIESGFDPSAVHSVISAEMLNDILYSLVKKQDVCLFKMSLDRMESSYRKVVENWVSWQGNK